MRRIAVLAGAALLLFAATAATPQRPLAPAPPGAPLPPPLFWKKAGCKHGHPSSVAYKRIRALVRNYTPMTTARGARARHYARCVATRRKARAALRKLRAHKRWRATYGPRWRIAFNGLPPYGQGWARSVSAAESGNRLYAPESGFLSYFQWVWSTWRAACSCSMSPYSASWYHQATVAWFWHLSHPSGQWPNTGE